MRHTKIEVNKEDLYNLIDSAYRKCLLGVMRNAIPGAADEHYLDFQGSSLYTSTFSLLEGVDPWEFIQRKDEHGNYSLNSPMNLLKDTGSKYKLCSDYRAAGDESRLFLILRKLS